jgi:pimeloyl-ACP methyl ester carboxylesterase
LRYSEAVVSSMAAALTTVLRARGDKRILLIGYSGGGVLATLLTRRVDNVVAVITVGANLDVAGWANAHRYTPLAGSLDPARLRPASATQTLIPELHYVGSDDAVVPPALLHGYARNRPGVQVIEWPGFGHVCCWVDVWPQVLARVGDAAASRPP